MRPSALRLTSGRRGRFDELGLRRAFASWTLPFVVGAMAFLASLAAAGWLGATQLSRHWQGGPEATLTVQVPDPGQPDAAGARTRLEAVTAVLTPANGVASATVLPDAQVNTLLRPWLGADVKDLALPVPAVIAVHMRADAAPVTGLAEQLAKAAPGTMLDDHAVWRDRLLALARGLRLCAGLVLMIVALVTAAVVVAATRTALAARRESVTIVSGLGATDGYIARRFANRAALLTAIGGAIGGVLALPALFALMVLAAPLAGKNPLSMTPADVVSSSMRPLWLLPVILPATAALIGYLTTQVTMRRWLRQTS